MTNALFVTPLLVVPALYFMAMLAAWACIRPRVLRIAVVSLMAIVPLTIAAGAARRAWLVTQAEQAFDAMCRSAPAPVVHGRVADVESILINVRAPARDTAPPDRHPYSVFAPEDATRLLLHGALRYSMVERPAGLRQYQAVDRITAGRPAASSAPASRYSIEWRSLASRSEFVTIGMMVVLDASSGRVLAEQQTLHFGSPPVAFFEHLGIGLQLLGAQDSACPSKRQLAHFVKSVARPAAAPGS